MNFTFTLCWFSFFCVFLWFYVFQENSTFKIKKSRRLMISSFCFMNVPFQIENPWWYVYLLKKTNASYPLRKIWSIKEIIYVLSQTPYLSTFSEKLFITIFWFEDIRFWLSKDSIFSTLTCLSPWYYDQNGLQLSMNNHFVKRFVLLDTHSN